MEPTGQGTLNPHALVQTRFMIQTQRHWESHYATEMNPSHEMALHMLKNKTEIEISTQNSSQQYGHGNYNGETNNYLCYAIF